MPRARHTVVVEGFGSVTSVTPNTGPGAEPASSPTTLCTYHTTYATVARRSGTTDVFTTFPA